ncbi:hypothetical protein GCM10028805_55570 [Spirosoma harenae]
MKQIGWLIIGWIIMHGDGYGQTNKLSKIPFYRTNASVIEIDIKLNNYASRFIVDSGASIISIGKRLYNALYQNKLINDSDKKYHTKTKLANGTLINAFVINIKKVNIGDFELSNVEAMVLETDDVPLLLGQNIIGRFNSFSIDNKNNQLILDGLIPENNQILIATLKMIPCNLNAVSELNRIKSEISKAQAIQINSLKVETQIPRDNAVKRIPRKITVRYFDSQDLYKASALVSKLVTLGYEENVIFLENMTLYYNSPISDYLEIWIK